jgi:hypothetical protein
LRLVIQNRTDPDLNEAKGNRLTGVRKSADAENRTPPDSRQHFDVWQFATADQDAGIRSLSTTSFSAGPR